MGFKLKTKGSKLENLKTFATVAATVAATVLRSREIHPSPGETYKKEVCHRMAGRNLKTKAPRFEPRPKKLKPPDSRATEWPAQA